CARERFFEDDYGYPRGIDFW
nr:immunoglobulin heavy chain junction region [Macaca mulatta]MOX40326.1 immunoglobulin heavy chain junction region [Macaca mulatta]